MNRCEPKTDLRTLNEPINVWILIKLRHKKRTITWNIHYKVTVGKGGANETAAFAEMPQSSVSSGPWSHIPFFFQFGRRRLLNDEGCFIKAVDFPRPQDKLGEIGAGCRYLEQQQPVATLAHFFFCRPCWNKEFWSTSCSAAKPLLIQGTIKCKPRLHTASILQFESDNKYPVS